MICSYGANIDSVRGFYCSPRSGGICWYIVEFLFLVPTFSFSQCIRFFISKLSFFRGLIILVPRVDAHLILISHLHSSAGVAPSQGHPPFRRVLFFLYLIPVFISEKNTMNKKTMNRLTEVHVRKAKPLEGSYKISDGGGMYLLVHHKGSKH